MDETNDNARLEMFCDAIFAVAITLLIIDLRVPVAEIDDTSSFWAALRHIAPSIFAFGLSFIIVFITWANHHAALKLVPRSSPSFVYANGLLMLSVVFIPFPTSLLGEFVLTDYSSPAVILYSVACALQAVGWFFLFFAALNPKRILTSDESSRLALREKQRYSVFSMGLYTLCGIAAIWLPQPVAVFITLTWLFWLLVSVSLTSESEPALAA
jgi:uncharacterized membrane protein